MVYDLETGKRGFVDRSFEFVIEPKFRIASDFSEGLSCASMDGVLWGFINRSGDWVIEPGFRQIHSFKEGLSIFARNEKPDVWGAMDQSGTVIVAPRFPHMREFQDGLSLVHYGSEELGECQSGYINVSGDFVWDCGDTWYPG